METVPSLKHLLFKRVLRELQITANDFVPFLKKKKYRKKGIFEDNFLQKWSYLLYISFSRELQLTNLQWFRPVCKEKKISKERDFWRWFNFLATEMVLPLIYISFSRELQLTNLQWFRPVCKEKKKVSEGRDFWR